MRFNKLSEWLEWQQDLHLINIDLGIARCTKVARKMDLLDPGFTVISVAGTNGKGSSIMMMETILSHCGYKTGCYTSPHFVRYNERIKLNNTEISDEVLCESFDRVDNARGDITLTYFEFGTLAALDIFHRSDIDIALLEVGLGGRLDAVNCLSADVALISSIGIDHTRWLGTDRESIAREKSGIFRSNRPAVCSESNPPKALINHAAELGSDLYIAGLDFDYQLVSDKWSWQSNSVTYTDLPLPGLYSCCQLQNAAGVLMALNALKPKLDLSKDAIIRGLQDFNPVGRFQILAEKVQIVMDVAHNVQAMSALVCNLKQLSAANKTYIIIGMLEDKDQIGILEQLAQIADYWHTVSLYVPRGSSGKALKDKLVKLGTKKPVLSHNTVADAFTKLWGQVGINDRVVVTGSFICVGDAMKYLKT